METGKRFAIAGCWLRLVEVVNTSKGSVIRTSVKI